jgi:hypothetical protein
MYLRLTFSLDVSISFLLYSFSAKVDISISTPEPLRVTHRVPTSSQVFFIHVHLYILVLFLAAQGMAIHHLRSTADQYARSTRMGKAVTSANFRCACWLTEVSLVSSKQRRTHYTTSLPNVFALDYCFPLLCRVDYHISQVTIILAVSH